MAPPRRLRQSRFGPGARRGVRGKPGARRLGSASSRAIHVMFIAFEGLDGSGGTTQLGLLAASIRATGRTVVVTREPSDGPVGQLIRAQLAGGEVGDPVFGHLFAADRRDHLDRVVIPALARGAVVLTDRYFLSSLAYQSLTLGLDRVWSLNAEFPAADAVVMLDLPVDVCLERVLSRGGTRDRFESLEQLRRVADAYEAAITRCRLRGDNIVRVDASGTPAEVHARVAGAVWPG